MDYVKQLKFGESKSVSEGVDSQLGCEHLYVPMTKKREDCGAMSKRMKNICRQFAKHGMANKNGDIRADN